MTTPVHRLPVDQRRQAALEHANRPVIVAIGREAAEEPRRVAGRVITVASPWVGTVADLLILRIRRPSGSLDDVAISLATVQSIEPVEAGR